jgi:hypothetical protein
MRIHAGLRPLKPSAKIKRQGGRRNGNERVNPKLLPGKATVDVPQVPQRGCGDDRSNQESQRILESGVDNVFHFFELSSKDLEPSHKLFLGFQGQLNWNAATRREFNRAIRTARPSVLCAAIPHPACARDWQNDRRWFEPAICGTSRYPYGPPKARGCATMLPHCGIGESCLGPWICGRSRCADDLSALCKHSGSRWVSKAIWIHLKP